MEPTINIIEIEQTMDMVMKKILTLGQSSLSESQYEAFRKLAMDYFQQGKRNLGKGRCGYMQSDGKGVVSMDT
jgi:hypothetical protein